MKNRLLLLLILTTSIGLSAQKQTVNTLYPYVKDNQWGFIDKNRNVIIEPQFERVQSFENGYAVVNDYCLKAGLINTSGKLIIPIKYDNIYRISDNFSDNLFIVLNNDSVGLVNYNGKFIIPPVYNHIRYCGEFLFEAEQNDLSYIFTNSGSKISENGFENIDIKHDLYGNDIIVAKTNEKLEVFDAKGKKINVNGLLGVDYIRDIYFVGNNKNDDLIYFDATGKFYLNKKDVLPLNYEPFEDNQKFGFKKNNDISHPAVFSDLIYLYGNIWAVKKDEKWGIIDISTNKTLYQFEFDRLENGEFSNMIYVEKNRKCGLISNRNLQVILPVEYDLIFENDLMEDEGYGSYYKIRKADKNGLINSQGQIILPCEYDNIIFQKPPVIITQKNNKYGLSNMDGVQIQPSIYDTIEIKEYLFDDSFYYIMLIDSLVGVCNGFGQIIANPIYQDLTPCDSDIKYAFSAKKDSKYGIVMLDNFEFVSCQYDEPVGIYEMGFYSYIPVIKNGKHGMLDSKGNIFIDCLYDNQISIELFYERYALVSINGKHGLLDVNGKPIIPCKYSQEIDIQYLYSSKQVIVEDSTKFGLFDIEKGEILPCILDEPPYYVLESNYNFFPQISNRKYGLIDKNGNILVPFIYDELYNENENYMSGYFVVSKNDKYGLVSSKNKIIIPLEYTSVSILENNDQFFYATRNDKYCIFNNEGIKIADEIYTDMIYLGEHISLAFTETDSVLIDYKGKKSTNPLINSHTYFSDGLSSYYSNGKFGYINPNGDIVIKAQFDSVCSFSEGLAAVKMSGKWGVINKKGKLLTPCEFDKINEYYQGYTYVIKNGKAGVIDKNGKIIIPPMYDDIDLESHNLFLYESNNKCGLIDNKGVVKTSAIFRRIRTYDSYIIGFSDSCESLINTKGVQVTDTIYDDITKKGQLFVVEIKDKQGIINSNGQIILPVEYDDIFFRNDKYFEIEKNDKNGLLDFSGKLLLPCIYDRLDYRNGTYVYELQSENDQKLCGKITLSPN